jgi:uncharacterized protein YjbJ (UPF0337 family)
MKTHRKPTLSPRLAIWLLTGCLVASFGFLGCKKQEEPGPIDTSRIEQTFATSDGSVKETLGEAVDAVKAGEYSEATSLLKELAESAKLTPEQQTAVKDFLPSLQAKLKELGEDALEGAKELSETAVQGARDAATNVKEAALSAKDAAVDSAIADSTREAKESVKDAAEDVKRQTGDALNRLNPLGGAKDEKR